MKTTGVAIFPPICNCTVDHHIRTAYSFNYRESILMAAYAALLSLMHTIDQIKNHPYPPIHLDEKQVLSLTQNLTFLQTFLERYNNTEENDLERRIASAANTAEDVIESDIVDQREDGRPLKRRCNQIQYSSYTSSVDLYQGLQRVVEDIDLIKKEVIMLMGVQDQLHSRSTVRPVSTWQNRTTMVGCDDALKEVMDKVTGQPDNLQIIPIVGMGGIGKTTLTRNIYNDELIVRHFDILAWVKISREFSRKEILRILCEETNGSNNDLSEYELGEMVYKELCGRRYLIVMDDVWSIEAWDKIKSFFPNNNNGSKIMVTTRLSNLAFQLSGSHGFQMKFLDEDQSWDLLGEIVFGKESCPIELEDIGKNIAKNCRGLPLSINVIGGLLAKSDTTREYWEYTLENLNSCINLENEEHCLQILHTSYKELPVRLKPCFLHTGVFPEDDEIRVSDLIKLWVAEGFLKPIDSQSLEDVAKECIDELIDRNLILIHKLRWNGKVKSCKVHDLLRDVCLREARKHQFICVLRQHDLNIPQGIQMDRRICIHENAEDEYSPQVLHALESAALTRSLLSIVRSSSNEPSPSFNFRLLRIYSKVDRSFRDDKISSTYVEPILQQANLRYLSVQVDPPFKFLSSWSLLWNLQTFKVDIPFSFEPIIAPSEIWEMPLLRHVMFNGLELPDPPPCGEDDAVLENLQTLSIIKDFKFSAEVVKRIPSIKTLKLEYSTDRLLEEVGLPSFSLDNLGRLQKLESLRLYLSYPFHDPGSWHDDLVQNLTFSRSLKKLTLRCTMLYWEDLFTTTKIGSLPLLEVLKLEYDSCIGPEWETVEGQFCSLKFLAIECCYDLKYWKTDETHFPRLEHLVLAYLEHLEEIPLCIGDIPTLKSIQVIACSRSAEDSAERIKEEQEANGNLDLKVHGKK